MAAAGSKQLKTSFGIERALEPIYGGGPISLSQNDGRTLATVMGDTIQITDLASGGTLHTIEAEGVSALLIVPNGKSLIVASRSFLMHVYSLDGQVEQLRKFRMGGTSPCVYLAADATSTLVAGGFADGLIRVWDISGGYQTHQLGGHGSPVTALLFWGSSTTEGGWRLASGGEDARVRIWDLVKSKCLGVLDAHASGVRSIAVEQSGKVLVSGARDQMVHRWDTTTCKLVSSVPVPCTVEACGFTGEQLMYCAGSSGRILLYKAGEATPLVSHAISDEEEEIVHLQYLNNAFFAVLANHTLVHVRISPPATLSHQQVVFGREDEILDVKFVGESDESLAIASSSNDLRMLKLQNGRSLVLQGHQDFILCMDRDYSGKWIVTGAKDNNVILWKFNEESWSVAAVYKGHTGSIGAVAISRGSHVTPAFVVSGSEDRSIKLWNVNIGEDGAHRARYTQIAHDKDINSIDVSFNDELIATASQDRTVKIWQAASGDVLGVLRGHKRGVWSCAFSANEKVIATGSGDRTVKVWDIETQACLRVSLGLSFDPLT